MTSSGRAAARAKLFSAADAAARKSEDPARHKCFICYHVDDIDEVTAFVDTYGHVFIPRVLGVTAEDDFVDSDDTDYIMDQISERYLRDSTVTLVMVGRCTWARRFVDWETYSSLRATSRRSRNGLVAITLPSVATLDSRKPPQRVRDNLAGSTGTAGYARWRTYPESAEQLRGYIDTAFGYRTSRANLVDNSRARRLRNATCP